MSNERSLAFGANWLVPEKVPAAWGARFIWPDDMLPDRQGTFADSDDDRNALFQWLNGSGVFSGFGALGLARRNARRLADAGAITSSGTGEVVLHDDSDGRIVADPHGSYGYLYVAAWLRGPWWDEPVISGFADMNAMHDQAAEIAAALTPAQRKGITTWALGGGWGFRNATERNRKIKAYSHLASKGLMESRSVVTHSRYGGGVVREMVTERTPLGECVRRIVESGDE